MSVEKLRADLNLASRDVTWGANPTITPGALSVFRALLDEHEASAPSHLSDTWKAANDLIQRYGESE